MKTTILKLSLFALLLIFTGAGCYWMFNSPNINDVWLYKTRGDYRHLYTIRLTGDENLNLWTTDKTLWTGLNKDTIYVWRQKAANGYVISGPAKLSDVYLSLTFKEVVLKEIAMNNPGHALPNDTLQKYIVDEDPYLEFWRSTSTLEFKDSVKINEIIRNGKIEKYFERLK
ncbi:MAG: hypothetical protein ACK5M7_02520 [Draconibacterium sp.]